MLELQSKISISSNQDQEFLDRLHNLDLEPIIFRVMYLEKTLWSLEKADNVAQMYRCFLYLAWKYPGKVIVPNKAVDQFWHQHILDTEKYHQDCQAVFGYFMHHFPYFGMRGEVDTQALNTAFAETLSLLKEQFGDTDILGNTKASDCLFASKSSDCLFEVKPSDCLFEVKPSDCLFANTQFQPTDTQSSDCLFEVKPSDCLFVNAQPNSDDIQASACLFEVKPSDCLFVEAKSTSVKVVDMSRPRPIRNQTVISR